MTDLKEAFGNYRTNDNKYVVIYSYYETEDSRKRLEIFMKLGIEPHVEDKNIHFLIVVNGGKISINLPTQASNISLLKRDNSGHDFAAWTAGIRSLKSFDRYIFMNDTVTGPYLPAYILHSTDVPWYVMFTSLLSNSVKLSGLTINSKPWEDTKYAEHVQSMIYCVDSVGLAILFDNHILGRSSAEYAALYKHSRRQYIIECEIGMSVAIRNAGYKVAALFAADKAQIKTEDVWQRKSLYSVNPYETMFIKANRPGDSKAIADIYERAQIKV